MLYVPFVMAQLPKPTLVADRRETFAGSRWRIVRKQGMGDVPSEVRVERDGRTVVRRTGDYMYDAKFLVWPYPGRLLAVARHTWNGSGMRTTLFRADRRGVARLGVEFDGEAGGPSFRDLDGDGRAEVVFDNDDWYVFYGKPPTQLIAYKYDGRRLRLWKRLPNREKKGLPYRLPFIDTVTR